MSKQEVSLVRQFAIARTHNNNVMDRLYWNADTNEWVPLHEATKFETLSDCLVQMNALNYDLRVSWTAVWVDPPEEVT